ncbi:MAG: ParB/RepB/Spo0J family partition protein [Limnochordales bacterium]|nr:ParB/RepB/Spo0J family partition protein [Limnochordales bacterium]
MGTTVKIPLSLIDRDESQCRTAVDEDALEGLARSLKEVGLLHPILVRRHGERYQIVAGERRYRAARLLGWRSIDALILPEGTEANDPRVQLIENLQREDLNPVDKARAVRRFMEETGMNKVQAAEALGIPRTTITDWLNVLEISPAYQQAVINNFQGGESVITLSHVSIAIGVARKAFRPQLAEELLRTAERYHLSKGEMRQVARLIQENWELTPDEAVARVRAAAERRRRAAERERLARLGPISPQQADVEREILDRLLEKLEDFRQALADACRIVPPGLVFSADELAAMSEQVNRESGQKERFGSPAPESRAQEWRRAVNELISLYEALVRVLQDIFGVDAAETADRRYLRRRRAWRRLQRRKEPAEVSGGGQVSEREAAAAGPS